MAEELEFEFSTIHNVLGVTAPTDGDSLLVDDKTSGTWACLTRDPEPYCRALDQSAAIGTMLLRGMVGGGPQGDFAERLRIEAEAVASERPAVGRNESYLVVRLNGHVPDWEPRAEREVDDIVIRVDGAPQLGQEARAKVAVASLVVALTEACGRPIRLRPFAHGIVFRRNDGKRLFAKEVKGGAVGLVVSGPWDATQQPSLQKDFLALQAASDLVRVRELFAASLESPKDRLRGFLYGWAGLEIFVNKVFPGYEAGFFSSLATPDDSDARSWYVERIRGVMTDKYRMRDRFALVASTLDSGSADKDVADFVEAKRRRDALAHGREVPDDALPVESVHQLLGKYLHLHTQRHASSDC